MMTIEEIRAALADRNLAVVARESGAGYNAIVRMVNGQSEPNYSTVAAVANYLREQAKSILALDHDTGA